MPPEHSAEVVIYTTGYCGYCHAAKRLLKQREVVFQEVPVDRRPELRQWLMQASNQRTVPQVFINGAAVGAYTELASLERSGKLAERLAQTKPEDARKMPT